MEIDYILKIDENGVYINKILIDEKIFREELYNYSVIEREDQIDHLIDWISEANRYYKEPMKEDLKYLIGLSDEYLFSSISTNDYIAKSDDLENFNIICKELIELKHKIRSEDRRDNKH